MSSSFSIKAYCALSTPFIVYIKFFTTNCCSDVTLASNLDSILFFNNLYDQ